MAVKGHRVTVAATATALEVAITAQSGSLVVRNRGSVAIYIGGSDVTSAAGYQLDPSESIEVACEDISPSGVYAITASGTAACHVLQVGV